MDGGGSSDSTADPDPHPHRDAPLVRRLLAEAVGTFALVTVAVGVDVVARSHGATMSPAARVIAPGLVVMALIHALADVSGAHFNSAVTTGFALRRDFPWHLVPAYVGAQLLGAVLGAGVWRLIQPAAIDAGVTVVHGAPGRALGVEVLLTFLLVLVIVNTATRPSVVGPPAALAVGGTIALCGILGGPISGASMNPARSVGPALVAGAPADIWVYVLGPLAGAALSVGVTWGLRPHQDPSERKAAEGEGEPAGSDRSSSRPGGSARG